MKTSVQVLAGVILSVSVMVGRAEEGVGVGVILGEPTGISIKKWMGPDRAVVGAVAWSFSESDSLQFHVDSLMHDFTMLKTDPESGRTAVYYGLGGRVKLEESDGRGRNNDHSLMGVRIPLGVEILPVKAPIDFFAEIVPILDLVPDVEFGINGAIGVRYFFR